MGWLPFQTSDQERGGGRLYVVGRVLCHQLSSVPHLLRLRFHAGRTRLCAVVGSARNVQCFKRSCVLRHSARRNVPDAPLRSVATHEVSRDNEATGAGPCVDRRCSRHRRCCLLFGRNDGGYGCHGIPCALSCAIHIWNDHRLEHASGIAVCETAPTGEGCSERDCRCSHRNRAGAGVRCSGPEGDRYAQCRPASLRFRSLARLVAAERDLPVSHLPCGVLQTVADKEGGVNGNFGFRIADFGLGGTTPIQAGPQIRNPQSAIRNPKSSLTRTGAAGRLRERPRRSAETNKKGGSARRSLPRAPHPPPASLYFSEVPWLFRRAEQVHIDAVTGRQLL